MNDEAQEEKKGIIAKISSFKGIVISLTALFVVIPAMINSGIDVYRSIAQIPDSIQEKTNDELFKRHFKESPVFSQPIEVKTGSATLEMMLDVYENGDILIQYGDFKQWFPFKGVSVARTPPFIGVAYAQDGGDATDPDKQRDADSQKTLYHKPLIIDIPQYQRDMEAQRDNQPETMEKSYLVTQMKDDHSSFVRASGKTYSMTFDAEPGYRIVRYKFRKMDAKAFDLKEIKLLDDGKSIMVTFTLKSGSIINRWKGWIKGTLQTAQERIR
jgi:hypothetical protein